MLGLRDRVALLAFALFVGAVVGGAISGGEQRASLFPGLCHLDNDNLPAVPRNMLSGAREDVVVLGPSPHVAVQFTLRNQLLFRARDNEGWATYVPLGRNHGSCRDTGGAGVPKIIKSEVIRQGEQGLLTAMHDESSGWSGTIVRPDGLNVYSRRFGWVVRLGDIGKVWLRDNECSLNGFEGFPRNLVGSQIIFRVALVRSSGLLQRGDGSVSGAPSLNQLSRREESSSYEEEHGCCRDNYSRDVSGAGYPISRAAFRSLATYGIGWWLIVILMFIPAGWLIQSGLEVEHVTMLSISKVFGGILIMVSAAVLYAHALFTIAERILYET
jgi:hypothetical protein